MNEHGRETLRRAAQAAWEIAERELERAAWMRDELHKVEAQAEAALMRREALVEAVREVEPEWQPCDTREGRCGTASIATAWFNGGLLPTATLSEPYSVALDVPHVGAQDGAGMLVPTESPAGAVGTVRSVDPDTGTAQVEIGALERGLWQVASEEQRYEGFCFRCGCGTWHKAGACTLCGFRPGVDTVREGRDRRPEPGEE